jgi:hypothetical protein
MHEPTHATHPPPEPRLGAAPPATSPPCGAFTVSRAQGPAGPHHSGTLHDFIRGIDAVGARPGLESLSSEDPTALADSAAAMGVAGLTPHLADFIRGLGAIRLPPEQERSRRR